MASDDANAMISNGRNEKSQFSSYVIMGFKSPQHKLDYTWLERAWWCTRRVSSLLQARGAFSICESTKKEQQYTWYGSCN